MWADELEKKGIPGKLIVAKFMESVRARGGKPLRDWWLASAKQACADPAIDGLLLDGVVKILNEEAGPGQCEISAGETLLAELG